MLEQILTLPKTEAWVQSKRKHTLRETALYVELWFAVFWKLEFIFIFGQYQLLFML